MQVEHGNSGLIWNTDNWIYTTRYRVRYRWVNNNLVEDSLPTFLLGQWGLAKDDYGRLFFSIAGGEVPALSFQQNPKYGQLELADQLARSEEHTSELQSLMRISYAVFCMKKTNTRTQPTIHK